MKTNDSSVLVFDEELEQDEKVINIYSESFFGEEYYYNIADCAGL